jgi:hypothetical protein
MSKPFSMTTVLRQTPFQMLRWFLPYIGIDLDFDWETLRVSDLPKVIAAYEAEPEEHRRQAEKIVQQIVVLANKKGVIAMRDSARNYGLTYWERMFSKDSSPYLQAIWAYVEHRDMFEMAKEMLLENVVSET